MQYTYVTPRTLVYLLVTVFCSVVYAQLAHAESVLWGTDVSDTLYYVKPNAQCAPMIGQIHADISYNVQALDVTQGTPLCHTSIPKGTKVLFKFLPHTSNDVYWFGTGFAWDSPYGDWAPQAVYPTGKNMCSAKNYVTYTGEVSLYGSLVVHPPTKHVIALDGFTCGAPNAQGDVQCTADTLGTFTPQFTFDTTYGKFYAGYRNGYTGGSSGTCDYGRDTPLETVSSAYWPQDGTGWRWCSGNQPYSLPVPAQNISCPITVVDSTGTPPSTPTITIDNGQCFIGSVYAFSARATDADGDQIRFAIDWDGDGYADQSTDLAPSGTAVRIQRTFALVGAKTFRIRAIDSNGLVSPWASVTFACTKPADYDASVLILGDELDASDWDGAATGTVGAKQADLTLRVLPSLVKAGDTSIVTWSAQHVSACKVVGSNGDGADGSWDGIVSPVGGKTTAPLQGETLYTLTCTSGSETLTRTARVRIIPNWKEI